ncbi:YdbL family protein [Hypericibacter sp.]|uniref:YdbL family protein n=1 Tax=Hypericibacter sp. TaxID=2705401 RepID=UPI003D6CBCD9
MYSSRRYFTRFALFGLLALVLSAFAATGPARGADDAQLNSLRAQGTIAERFDGYVMVKDNSTGATAQSVVDRVNAERRAIYEARAKAQGVTANEVGQVYAGQIIQKAPKGTWFLAADGSWTQK